MIGTWVETCQSTAESLPVVTGTLRASSPAALPPLGKSLRILMVQASDYPFAPDLVVRDREHLGLTPHLEEVAVSQE